LKTHLTSCILISSASCVKWWQWSHLNTCIILLFLKFVNKAERITHVWQKWRCITPLDNSCYIQHSFSAMAFVVKIATFAKRGNVAGNATIPLREASKDNPDTYF